MEDTLAKEYQFSPPQEKEFTVLLPALALISCAFSRAAELDTGFEWGDDGWMVNWPEEVIRGMGLRPTKARAADDDVDSFCVLYQPSDDCEESYWSALFGAAAPALVISYEASMDKPPMIYRTDYEWLHWPWYVSEEQKLAALDKAIASHEELEKNVDWPKLAEQSATVGPKSALFEGVVRQLAAQSSVNDTL